MFMLTLTGELAAESKPPESRRSAGILLKNLLTAKVEITFDYAHVAGSRSSLATTAALGGTRR